MFCLSDCEMTSAPLTPMSLSCMRRVTSERLWMSIAAMIFAPTKPMEFFLMLFFQMPTSVKSGYVERLESGRRGEFFEHHVHA